MNPSRIPLGAVLEKILATNNIGAVSPKARAIERIVPVAIPGTALGRT